MSWIQVFAEFPECEDLSPYIEIFRDFGIENTLENDCSLTGALPEVPGVETRVAELTAALETAGALKVLSHELPEENWELAWRQFFKPRRIGHSIVVRPTWEAFESAPDDVVLVLDPGQAFGTGDHPTTRLCLELLETAELTGAAVADVGCGSGILSIAAIKLGARHVLAIDIEPISIEVTRQNAALNAVSLQAEVAEGLPPEVVGERVFDVVISNIISAILIRLARDVYAVTKPGSRWIVSGIIVQNWPDVLSAAETAGFSLENRLEEDGWVAARFSRQ